MGSPYELLPSERRRTYWMNDLNKYGTFQKWLVNSNDTSKLIVGPCTRCELLTRHTFHLNICRIFYHRMQQQRRFVLCHGNCNDRSKYHPHWRKKTNRDKSIAPSPLALEQYKIYMRPLVWYPREVRDVFAIKNVLLSKLRCIAIPR